MAMEITNSFSNSFNGAYERIYAAQRQQAARSQATQPKITGQQIAQPQTVQPQTSKQPVVAKMKTKETAATWKNSTATSDKRDYLDELSKLAPSVKFRVGYTHASAKSGKTLTINPKLMEKMQNDPEFEKEMKELIKGVELMTKFSEGLNRANGWTTVFRHGYIDENGKYSHSALVRNDAGYKMSAKLREERWKASENLVNRIKERTAKRKKELKKIDIRI